MKSTFSIIASAAALLSFILVPQLFKWLDGQPAKVSSLYVFNALKTEPADLECRWVSPDRNLALIETPGGSVRLVDVSDQELIVPGLTYKCTGEKLMTVAQYESQQIALFYH